MVQNGTEAAADGFDRASGGKAEQPSLSKKQPPEGDRIVKMMSLMSPALTVGPEQP